MASPVGTEIELSPGCCGHAAGQVARVRALGQPVLEDVGQRALADSVHALDGVFPRGGNYRLGTRTLPGLTDAAIDAFLQAAEAMPATCALITHHSSPPRGSHSAASATASSLIPARKEIAHAACQRQPAVM